MSFKFSEELRRQQCVVGSLKSILDGGVLRLYSGAEPSTSDAALDSTHVLLCEISADGAGGGLTFESSALSATLTKSLGQVWQGSNVESGSVKFFRYVMPSDSGLSNSSEVRIQGSVGGPNADLTISNANLIVGAPLRLEYFAISLLESA